jgi:hypothetical protein
MMRNYVLFSHQILCRRQHEKKGVEGFYEEVEEEEEEEEEEEDDDDDYEIK